MAKTFVLHDETVNTYGFRMLISGCDLTEFRKNPVMLLNHSDWSLPIGRWENIRVEDGKILADPVFDMKDERARQIADKVENNFLRMASIGAWPPEEVSDAEWLKLPGQKQGTVTQWKVREASIVTIGANHNALCFYDQKGNAIDLADCQNVIRLFDNNNYKFKKDDKMNILKGILNLADTASENDVAVAVRGIIANSDRLKAENATLTARIDELNKETKEKKKNEAIALVDSAVKGGRLDAKAKDSYLKLFDTDFDSAKATLEAIPKRQSIFSRLESSTTTDVVELADLQKQDWDILDKAGKLVLLRDNYPELYKEKFKARFGCEPK